MLESDLSSLPKELRKLIKKRQSIKDSINSVRDYVNKFIPASSSVRQLQIRLSKLTAFMAELSVTQEAIVDFELGYDDVTEQVVFDDFTFTLVADMEELIEKHGPSTTSSSMHPSNQSRASVNETMRLPTINIPTFNGEIENWASYIDTFNALFHNNKDLPNVHKMHYLKSGVCGTAAEVIKSFSITSDNYQAAYDELVKPYENKALTIQVHIRALLNSPKVHTNCAAELKKLHYHVNSHVRSLIALKQPVQHWDAWLTTIVCCHLDPTTAGEWQLLQTSKELPAFKDIESFLSKRIAAYEVGYISSKSDTKQTTGKSQYGAKKHDVKAFFAKKSEPHTIKCVLCTEPHRIYACNQFNQMSVSERKDVVTKFKLCFNCLNFGHQVESCYYPGCPRCKKKHNSRLHVDSSHMSEPKSSTQTETQTTSQDNAVCHAMTSNKHAPSTTSTVMLATAVINVHDADGRPQRCRAILDSGSQLNFITSSCAQRLRLKKTNVSLSISGVGTMSSSTVRLMPCTVSSHCQNYQSSIEFHSLPTITERLPHQMFSMDQLNIPDDVKGNLADPQLNVPAAVDILFGAELFYDIFLGARKQLSKHISVHNTKLGWILVGKLFEKSLVKSKITMLSTPVSTNSALSLFTSTTNAQFIEEAQAEKHFSSTVKRDESGRFVVKLPVNDKITFLGDSRPMAERRFYNLERRLSKDEKLAEQYNMFISEYLALNHMELANPTCTGPKYYLPHHPVFKANSTTTKLRVVFDGSANTKSGIALNDVLLKGPKVQSDIFHILLRFRIHQVVITADVEKMYRQVLVAPEDRDLQRILYRKSPTDQLQEYRLCTVTYGTKSASYLATRCLSEIGKCTDNPKLNRVITQDFYVDDLLSGGASEDECYQIYSSLVKHFSPAGFPLRKWCSNSVNLINQIPSACNDPTFVLKLSENDTVTALGLTWQPITDQFRFTFKHWSPPLNMTKRTLLSDINSVYDPIGLISPVLILGKIFIQQLWGMKMSWDDIIPSELQARWIKFYNSLQSLHELAIPRKVINTADSKVTIHGFCDASQEAFGACIYLRSASPNGQVQVHLLASKSRVAPMKATTIPRLELCGAVLLSELLLEVKNELSCLGMQFSVNEILLWTDSSIVLAWLKNEVPLLSYVANRVARILDITVNAQWRHVISKENPADQITRGIHPAALPSLSIWWNGPSWLLLKSDSWPGIPELPSEIPEVRPVKLVLATTHSSDSWLLNKYSSYMQLIRITALVQRFVHNCTIQRKLIDQRTTGALTVQDLKASREFWIRKIQAEAYPSELKALNSNLPIHRSSCLLKLNPFVDGTGILRVGGRLAYAPIHDNTKFPVVLPPSSTFTRLFFKYEHLRLLHVGPQALLSHIQVNYWPIRGRSLASRTVHQCIQCFRTNPKLITPFMAPLPRQRTTIERPFSQCGVDFCGPIMIRSGIRRVKTEKAYISVFVCLVTRAIHLELVSSLTADAFLATLTRFMSRRGQCSNLFSDNGTNFVGANRKLMSQFEEISKTHTTLSYLSEKSMQWHFIPPSAPHFGGLWEAAVKSSKQLLTKISSNATFTFEEATTLLCGIEGVLNSRPMTPLSNDPSDYQALTPAHFLIGGVITLPPEADSSTTPMSRLKRFALVQSCIQQFWKRWSREYLPQLQRRGRWIKATRNIRVGDLCLLRQENLPPTRWALVRVQDVHPGPDGTVRVVTLRNSSGNIFKRPVVKLSLLPSEEDEREEQP
ncbi:unnamed protein product [Macrosiphum euphorbiae]|uniref:Integrase catalytic domain-containing protein n=1 Tax=Macrosiphum euphorbiae TaxID=13131 RepID=A0AAV0XJL0_9HEMI|nr:unnamed protein product [Macrosiphum euphorbiae]